MKVFKILIVAAVLIAAFSQLHAQPVAETLTVDTLVNLGKVVPGEASGAFFLPDGNIIAIKGDTPYIIDSESGEILRRLDSLIGQDIQFPKVSPDGRYLIAFSYKGTAVWDIVSGKILKMIGNATDYCFSPDGLKLYIIGGNPNNLGAVRVYDANTLEEIERFADFTGGTFLDLSPDGLILAASFGKRVNEETFNQFVLINLNDKNKYTVVETVKPGIKSMEFSTDGKKVVFHYNDGNKDNYIYIYNLETKEKKYIKIQELSTLFGFKIAYIGYPKFIDKNTILFQIGSEMDENIYYFSWNISENRLKNYIKIIYNQSIDVKDDLVLFCNSFGVIGYISKDIVPVINNIQKGVLLTYIDHRLEYQSDISFKGESIIYDLTGKTIMNLGIQNFIVGKNYIRVNQNLPLGIYILSIKFGTEQISKKFMVE